MKEEKLDGLDNLVGKKVNAVIISIDHELWFRMYNWLMFHYENEPKS